MKAKFCFSLFWLYTALNILTGHLLAQPPFGERAIVSNDADLPHTQVSLSGNGSSITPAEFGIFYATTDRMGNPPASLTTIDPITGAGTLVGSTHMIYGLPGLAINSKGEIYGTNGYTGDLYRIDAATGEAQFSTKTGAPALGAIAFDRNDSLYGISNERDELYLIDPVNGSASLIGPLGEEFAELAFNPIDGTLWASQSRGGVFTIDPATAMTRFVGIAGFLGLTLAIEFDNSGNLFGTVAIAPSAADRFIAIDRTTGAGRRIGTTGFKVITALASRPGTIEGPQICVLHTKVSFGRVLVGTVSSLRTVNLRSVGNDTLIVTCISDPGAPFLLSNLPELPLILPPGSAATFQVAFAPANTGDVTATFSIASNDANDPNRSIDLSGQAKIPAPAGSALFASDWGASAIVRLDPITFSALDTIPTPEPPSISAGDIAYDGSSLFFSGASLFYTLDPLTGEARRSIPVPACLGGAMAHSGNSLFGWCSDLSISELDPITGLVLNNFKPEVNVTGSLSFGGRRGTLFAYVNNWLIAELNASTGAVINSFEFQHDDLRALAYSDHLGVLFVSSSNGYVYMLNPDNGSVIDSCWAPVSIDALCADEYMVRTGAHLALGPREMDFGKHVLGKKSSPRNLLLRSIGTDTVTVFGLVPLTVPFELGSLPPFPLAIPPMGRVEIPVTFSPSSIGPIQDEITAMCDDVNEPTQITTIRGEGVAPPPPGTLFGSLAKYLYILDPTTAARQFVGVIDRVGSVTEIEFRSDGTLFGTTGGQSTKLITINVPDGAPEIVAECCVDERCTISALEFDAANRLYGAISYFAIPHIPTQLVIIDTETGEISSIGPIGDTDEFINGLTFGPDSVLYGVYSEFHESYLITIDRFTGVSKVIGPIGFEDISSMEFGPDGLLYGGIGELDRNTGGLITIDPKTGKGTLVGGGRFSAWTGLSFYPDTEGEPEAVDDAARLMSLPSEFALSCNYPNPFNPTTQIRYQLPKAATVTMTIFNVLGQKVRNLVRVESQAAGYHQVEWDGCNDAGAEVSSGVYFCYFEAHSGVGNFEKKLKMGLVR